MDFETDIAKVGDLIESFLRMLECSRSGTIGVGNFPIDVPAGHEDEVYQSVSQRLKKGYPWVALTLTSKIEIECYGITP
ncbi:hypothetical protein [Pseudomonas syringae]|uniref:hypothetical protein n=1 Tax=Pseudomonas syringae TaxID=317 RepID=UPI00177FC1D3|nr:hypothetical protein [Pseudomonas syringae]MBD8804600.1 hypothetical protein [Pseudomonas syringae]MDC3739664.1 hypothetical protein [Pseudomonas syringae pv. syringae]